MVTNKTPKKQWVYRRLVTSDADVVGLIAYGFYKHRKSELADGYRKQGLDETSTAQKLREFHDQVVSGNGEVDQYRRRAEQYLDRILADTHKHALEEAIDRVVVSAKNQQDAKQPLYKVFGAWLLSGVPSAISTLVLTVVVLGSMLFFASKEHKAMVASDLVNKMTGEEIVAPKDQQPASQLPAKQADKKLPATRQN